MNIKHALQKPEQKPSAIFKSYKEKIRQHQMNNVQKPKPLSECTKSVIGLDTNFSVCQEELKQWLTKYRFLGKTKKLRVETLVRENFNDLHTDS